MKNLKDWIQSTLKLKNIIKLNNIQTRTIEVVEQNKNVIGISPTGTGKTYAFLLPILNKIQEDKSFQCLILSPTKELARQLSSKVVDFKKTNNKLKSCLLIGGEDINNQISNLEKKPNIVIATPDRCLKIIEENNHLFNLTNFNYLVLDEADMLLDLGFFNTIDKIYYFLNNSNNDFIKLAFSATFHDMLSKKLSKYFQNAEIIDETNKLEPKKNIEHTIIYNHDKKHSLSILLNTINPYLCLIFANTKKEVDEIFDFLKSQNRQVIKLHGDLKNRQRKSSFKTIQLLKTQYVVCSDLASRGLDIEGASHVISWNIPNNLEWYIHRSGRVGRNKYTGYSYILVDNLNDKPIQKLDKLNLDFKMLIIKNNELVVERKRPNKKIIKSQEQINELKKVYTKSKVKPNYKKNQKLAIEKINKKYKRKEIDKKIKQNTNRFKR